MEWDETSQYYFDSFVDWKILLILHIKKSIPRHPRHRHPNLLIMFVNKKDICFHIFITCSDCCVPFTDFPSLSHYFIPSSFVKSLFSSPDNIPFTHICYLNLILSVCNSRTTSDLDTNKILSFKSNSKSDIISNHSDMCVCLCEWILKRMLMCARHWHHLPTG